MALAAPSSVTVNTTSGLFIAQNMARKGLNATNSTNGTIWFSNVTPTPFQKGNSILPGGTYSMTDKDFTTDALYAISDTDGCVIALQEYI